MTVARFFLRIYRITHQIPRPRRSRYSVTSTTQDLVKLYCLRETCTKSSTLICSRQICLRTGQGVCRNLPGHMGLGGGGGTMSLLYKFLFVVIFAIR
jgi:hypothetical protein